jgi:hypothetical protein
MAVNRQPVSISQFCELLALDPATFLNVEVDQLSSRVVLVTEGDGPPPTSTSWIVAEHRAMSQTSAIIPQLNQTGIRMKPTKKGGGKKRPGC